MLRDAGGGPQGSQHLTMFELYLMEAEGTEKSRIAIGAAASKNTMLQELSNWREVEFEPDVSGIDAS